MPDQAQRTALTKRRAEDVALMPPPALPKRIKRPSTVLDEDVYTEALSDIIARDFFPGLLETKAQQEYLDAVESKDKTWIRQAGHALKEAMTPDPYGRRGRSGTSLAQTPATIASTVSPSATPQHIRRTTADHPFQTPGALSEASTETAAPEVDRSLSLTAFQAKYTSEDNASFNEVLDKQNEKRARKYAHLRNDTNNLPSNRLLLYRQKHADEAKIKGTDAPSTAIILRPSQDLDARKASFDTFTTKQGAKNNLMFAPDGIEDNMVTLAKVSEERSLAPPRRTNFAATRLPGPESSSGSDRVPPSPSMSAVDAAIRGEPRLTDSERGSMADYSGAETPMVAGWRFVDEEPTAAEEAFARGEPVDEEVALQVEHEEAMKLMPRIVDGSHTGAGFHMSAPGKREELLGRLVEKTTARERRKQSDTKKGSERGSMTPAARNLAGRLGGTPVRDFAGNWFGEGKFGASRKSHTPYRTPGVKR